MRQLEDGNTLLVGIPDDRTEHMAKMIGSQKAEARAKRQRPEAEADEKPVGAGPRVGAAPAGQRLTVT